MGKLIGNKIKSAVFISGNGSNLNSIIKNSKKKNFPIKISLVISNKSSAKGIRYAKKNNIPYKIFNSLKAYSAAFEGGAGSSSQTLYISPALGFWIEASRVCAKSST